MGMGKMAEYKKIMTDNKGTARVASLMDKLKGYEISTL